MIKILGGHLNSPESQNVSVNDSSLDDGSGSSVSLENHALDKNLTRTVEFKVPFRDDKAYGKKPSIAMNNNSMVIEVCEESYHAVTAKGDTK